VHQLRRWNSRKPVQRDPDRMPVAGFYGEHAGPLQLGERPVFCVPANPERSHGRVGAMHGLLRRRRHCWYSTSATSRRSTERTMGRTRANHAAGTAM
jgi:hypothetical protein